MHSSSIRLLFASARSYFAVLMLATAISSAACAGQDATRPDADLASAPTTCLLYTSATCWAAAAELSQNSDGAELTVSPRYSSQNGYWLGAPPGAVVSCARYSEMLFGSHMLYEGHVALLERCV